MRGWNPENVASLLLLGLTSQHQRQRQGLPAVCGLHAAAAAQKSLAGWGAGPASFVSRARRVVPSVRTGDKILLGPMSLLVLAWVLRAAERNATCVLDVLWIRVRGR